MLYFRESALSEFNGHEFVNPAKGFNSDVSNTHTRENYQREDILAELERVPVTQSIYLLTDHKLAFALDYPLSIIQMTTPKKTTRFKSSYRAYSMAPAFTLDELRSETTGNPEWTEEVRAHYLVTHPDQRYAEFAKKITAGVTDPVEKAFKITDYLSANAIYTLTPHHDTEPEEDPVAPFLFGDLRGYCVHFAHATAYMLRALGIPARVGTGYLTNLSQARDGHILLRMNDRHAWAEAYITDRGWVPFDTQPDQVESHAETPVDMNLLEELMGLLEPGAEILPEDILAGEFSTESSSAMYIPNRKEILFILCAIFLTLFLIKFYLRYQWLLPGNATLKLRRGYTAFLSLLYDLGIHRHIGETRHEFQQRAGEVVGFPMLSMTTALTHANYSSHTPANAVVRTLINQELKSLNQIPRWKRVLGFFNPGSIFFHLGSRRW